MFFSEKSSRAVPPVPSTLNATPADDGWRTVELDDGHDGKKHGFGLKLPVRPTPNRTITPYLGLRARLSQVPINRFSILLLLVMVRVFLLSLDLDEDIADAKEKANAACTKVEDIGSAMASMPHYLSAGVNSMAAKGINKSVEALVTVLNLLLTVMESLIFFFLNLYLGTYVCLISALIHGSLDVAVGAIEGTTKAMNDAIGPITDSLNSNLANVQNSINDVVGKIAGGIGGVFGGSGGEPPRIDVSGVVNDLHNIKIDSSSIVGDIMELNKTIPNFDEIETLTRKAIGIPFGFVREQIEKELGNFSFDNKIFPLAEKQSMTFCSTNSFINDFFGALSELVRKARIAFLIVLPLLAVAAMVIMGYLEVRRWRREKERARIFTQNGYDAMDVVYLASRPMTSGFALKMASRFKGRKAVLFRWSVAYGTSLPALFVLSLAVAGMFGCFCQFLLLRGINNEAPALAGQVRDFAQGVVDSLKGGSSNWSDKANAVVGKVESDINDDLFGWIHNATDSLKSSVVTLDQQMDQKIDDIFGDTVLLNTARNIVDCLIGRKIDTITKGLEFVVNVTHVTLPRFEEDIFSKGSNDSINGDKDLTSFLSSPSSVTTDDITGAVTKVTDSLQKGILVEALISLALLLLYIIIAMMGVVRALILNWKPEKVRGEGGEQYDGEWYASKQDEVDRDTFDSRRGSVVYEGEIRGGKAGSVKWASHTRKSSYPELGDAGR